MQRIPAHLRSPALYALVGLALVALATAARAQAEGLPPVADPGLGALAPLLDGAGPAGVVVAVLVGVWREWRAEAQRHAAERAELRRDLQALTGAVADVRHALDLERARHDAATQRLHDLLTAARAAAEART